MAVAWVLRDERVTSALIGAHSVEQLDNALETLQFTHSELNKIDHYAQEGTPKGDDLWRNAAEERGIANTRSRF